jgi:aryl-alcohol dehydrogenase-like predicted oxidoreductase
MPHFATLENTKQYSKKFPEIKYNPLGQTNLSTSPAGFGSYRVHISVDEHSLALEHALLNGINLIDTSSNYADGGSEELIGAVIKNLVSEKRISREEIVVVSKVGYLQGQNFQLSQQLKQQNKSFPELVEYANGLEHCIHPDFIEDQLTRSLNRLQLKTIDVYLLHNPEYYLLWAHKQGMDLAQAQEEYYRRIEQAFMHLEIEVQNGRIRHYGISSNTFPVASNRYDFTSLEKVWDIAEGLSPSHNFRAVQMPMNLLEHQAITEKNQSKNKTVLEFAESKKLAVLVNRPLNAFSNNQLRRLVSLETNQSFDLNILQEKFSAIKKLELDFTDKILPSLKTDEDNQKNLAGYFSSGSYLSENWQKLGPYWQWIGSQAQFLTEQISYAVQLVNEIADNSDETIKWLDKYVELFNDLLGYMTLYYGDKTARDNNNLFQQIKTNNDNFKNNKSLQQLAVLSLTGTKSISCALVGMRRVQYVDNIINTLKSYESDIEGGFWVKLKQLEHLNL